MATLTPTLTLTSSDLTADEALSVSITDSLTVMGQYVSKTYKTSTTSAQFLAHAAYTKAYVYLHNQSSTSGEDITIETSSGGGAFAKLAPGEFAFFPWTGATSNLWADADAGTPILEVRVFETAIG